MSHHLCSPFLQELCGRYPDFFGTSDPITEKVYTFSVDPININSIMSNAWEENLYFCDTVLLIVPLLEFSLTCSLFSSDWTNPSKLRAESWTCEIWFSYQIFRLFEDFLEIMYPGIHSVFFILKTKLYRVDGIYNKRWHLWRCADPGVFVGSGLNTEIQNSFKIKLSTNEKKYRVNFIWSKLGRFWIFRGQDPVFPWRSELDQDSFFFTKIWSGLPPVPQPCFMASEFPYY